MEYSLTAIPNELLHQVVSHLDTSSLYSLMLCRHLYYHMLLRELYREGIWQAQQMSGINESTLAAAGGPRNPNNMYPLHWICRRGYTGMLAMVLTSPWANPRGGRRISSNNDRHGTGWLDLDARDHMSCSPVWHAVAEGHTIVVAQLLAAGGFPLTPQYHGRTVLSLAAGMGHLVIVRMLMAAFENDEKLQPTAEMVAERDVPDCDGYAPLTHACRRGHFDIVRLLLADEDEDDEDDFEIETEDDEQERPEGADGRVDRYGYTVDDDLWADNSYVGCSPLMQAVIYGHADVVALLLRHGVADADLPTYELRTPLSIAAENGDVIVASLLLSTNTAKADEEEDGGFGGDFGEGSSGGSSGQAEGAVGQLGSNGQEGSEDDEMDDYDSDYADNDDNIVVDVNRTDNLGRTALMYAIQAGSEAVVQLLLVQPDIDVIRHDRTGRTALMWAEAEEKKQLEEEAERERRMGKGKGREEPMYGQMHVYAHMHSHLHSHLHSQLHMHLHAHTRSTIRALVEAAAKLQTETNRRLHDEMTEREWPLRGAKPGEFAGLSPFSPRNADTNTH
ncbi:ankyrin repeat-containing protein [Grosmannia clavigera kw1407]|uniref:Ankyrin repeat-containing protein n=1 Tax=Grosmannia clavigera (strain kw1407 / UAMH 11150) TaxID=655863 RepID=F0XBF9_GROCL|nr:ankyrin repeat-containing protein [Grosmannia clavigera kw1407]EFX04919.1 ankyrin repeat-containing protein [Grosmannia clavigera kw1407]